MAGEFAKVVEGKEWLQVLWVGDERRMGRKLLHTTRGLDAGEYMYLACPYVHVVFMPPSLLIGR